MSERYVSWSLAGKLVTVLALLKLTAFLLDNHILVPYSYTAIEVQKKEEGESQSRTVFQPQSPPKTLNELFERRMRAMERRCSLYKRDIELDLAVKEPVEIFQFSDLQLKWCPVYKGGSTNMIRTLCPKYYSPNTCQIQIMSAELLRNDPEHRFNEQRPSSYPSLLIVRDPFERSVSCYLDKILKQKKSGFEGVKLQILSLYRPIPSEVVPYKDMLLWNAVYESDEKKIWTHDGVTNPYHDVPTFSEFIAYITSGHYNDHWMPIFHQCQPCFYRYDYILKLEHFDEEFSTLISEKQLEIEFKLYRKNRSSSQSKVIELFSTLSETQLKAFHDIYQADCQLFEYDCEKTMKNIRTHRVSLNVYNRNDD